jgi:serine phosphatase RsbU (regulator of sigma subunit)
MTKLGLRAKSLLALALACLLALVPAIFLGWKAMDAAREHFGRAYADNFVLLSRQQILTPLLRELALSQRLAESQLTLAWLRDPSNPQRREAAFRELEGYRHALRSQAYFVIDAASGDYFYNGPDKSLSEAPRYRLSRSEPDDAWFYETIAGTAPYNINVNPDLKLHVTRVWFNVIIRDDGKVLGLAGASLDLSDFLRAFTGGGETGVTPMLIDEQGAIQAHPEQQLIAYNSGSGAASSDHTLYALSGTEADRASLRAALAATRAEPAQPRSLWMTLQGKRQLVSLAYVPELHWYVVAAVDLGAAHVIDTAWFWPVGIAVLLLLISLLVGFGYAVDRLVLRPVRRLQQSARAIAAGRYDVSLPPPREDEVGDLSRAFGVMAEKVRSHTEELEGKVRERTLELQAANQAMAAAHKKIDDSIDYASLIQQAILPNRQLTQSLGAHHFVMWKPRDVVGGDLYVFQADGANCMLGVLDCAGHGVPGALMTMLVRAALDVAMGDVGVGDPALVLSRTDAAMSAMLADTHLPRGTATNTDAGLVYVDRARARLLYAGARLALYASNGEQCLEYRGSRRALNDKRAGSYANLVLPLDAGWTYYLATDGFLDQAGGEHGFGFGGTRFTEMLKAHAARPLQEQGAAFEMALAQYRGNLPQRDDITILCFRFD